MEQPAERLPPRRGRILKHVVEEYVVTAQPVSSDVLVRKYVPNVSSATVRSELAALEDRGFLYHPHTSAGRVPTDLAYRLYVDVLLGQPRPLPDEERSLRQELESASERSAVEDLIRHAAQVLGLLTQELGIAVAAGTYWHLVGDGFAPILERQSTVLHACEAETSMMLALHPQLVAMDRVPAGPQGASESPATGGAGLHRWRTIAARSASGVIGVPQAASAAKGERLLEAIAATLASRLAQPSLWEPG